MANAQLSWSFGLRNADNKYLTVEAFGSNVNMNAKAMKKKQIFFMEHVPGAESNIVYLRTWQNKYLTVDDKGKVSAGADQPGEDEQIKIEFQPDGSWSLVTTRHYYIHGERENVNALIKDRLPDAESHKFTVHLAMHPQVCILNVNRKRYLHLNRERNIITCDEDIPWGDDAVINLDFFEDGFYGLKSCDGTYLKHDSQLVAGESDDVKFQLEFHDGELAFKSKATQKYLTCSAQQGTVRALKDSANKDELFVLEDSHPQLKMTSEKGLKVSVRGGIEVAANQKDTQDTEIFQLEAHDGKWALKSNAVKFWSCGDDGAIKAEAEDVGANELFMIKWLDAQLAIVAANGKLVSVSGNNYLKATTDLVADADIPAAARFVYELVNRPRLVLRGEHGFIGTLPMSGVLECNKSTYETFSMHISKGVCEIKGTTKDGAEKFWQVSDDRTKITVSGMAKQAMYMEFVEDSKFAIRYKESDGSTYYLKGCKNGALEFTGTEINAETLWEF